jgi:hypothetical protein
MVLEQGRMSSVPTSGSRIHLAVLADGGATPELTKAIAEVLGIAAYDVGLRLREGPPKSLCCCSSIGDAESKAAVLNELGLLTIVYEQDHLPPAAPFRAIGLKRTKTALHFRDRRESIVVLRGDIALLVYGRRMLTREVKEVKPQRWYSARQALTTGLPLALEGLLSTSRYETSGQHFLMLFRRDPELPAIEIGQEGFDFQCLGENRGRSRLESLQLVTAALRKILPNAEFDDQLARGQSNNRGEAFYNLRLVADSSSANATMIYWRMLAEQSGRRHFTARSSRQG